jgi:2,4-dienoyl-CoA reductase-like NADH-dependent reductase (Old Yellow Enzyme family)
METPHLFAPLTLRGVTLRNRIVVSPMCQYSSVDGFADDWHLVHLGSRAVGGAAAVIAEASAVLPEGRISPDDLGIWKDEHTDGLARIFRFIEDRGAVPAIQLSHAGRKASTSAPFKGGKPLDPADGGWAPVVAASAIAFDTAYQVPEALDEAEIERVTLAFAQAASRARDAGARMIELHAAHGYLLHQFLSPLSNHRQDKYGGSFDNRTRLVRETVEAIRRVWPDQSPLLVRISASDWADGGWTPEDSVALAARLVPLGVDLVDCSSGGLVPRVRIPVGAGYQVPFADRIRRETQMPTAAVGMITSAEQADQIVRNGQADLIVIAREFLRNPYWPLHAAQRLGHDVEVPLQYRRAF